MEHLPTKIPPSKPTGGAEPTITDATYQLLEAGKRTLVQAKTIDVVKNIRYTAEVARTAARLARDTELEELAIEVRTRAERRAGQMLKAAREAGDLATHGDNRHTLEVPNRNLLTLTDIDITKKQSADWTKLAGLDDPTFEKHVATIKVGKTRMPTKTVLRFASIAARMPNGEIESDHWNSSPEIIERVRRLMGDIDVDPASNIYAQEVVKAKRYFSKDDDGLVQDWRGRVYLNPPYSQPLIGKFIAKLKDEYKAGHVTEAVMLVNNDTSTDWFQTLVEAATVMFTRKRLSFWRPGDNESGPAPQGQALFYLGPKVDEFLRIFGEVAYAPNIKVVAGKVGRTAMAAKGKK